MNRCMYCSFGQEEQQQTFPGPKNDLTADMHGLPRKKVGRPFKGEVNDQQKEPYVPERRSILRAFKKFYAKR